jgi:hypothetical protein
MLEWSNTRQFGGKWMRQNAEAGRRPVIHIGMPKTATKTLQWRLFAEHREIFYLGRFDGFHFGERYRQFDACRDGTVQAIMRQIAYGNPFNPDFNECRRLLQLALGPAHRNNLVPVWSWESYAVDIPAKVKIRARNLKRVFNEPQIIITLRNPVALLESAYFQQMKRDNVGGGDEWRAPYYYPIDVWLKKEWNGEIMPHLRYAETIQAYVDFFGIENIFVFIFEDLIADRESFFRNVCRVMGVNEEEGLRLIEHSADNVRWTVEQVRSLQTIKSSLRKSLMFKLMEKEKRKTLLGLNHQGIPIEAGEKARAPIPREWQERIYTATADGNRWLMEAFGLPLDRYRYFGH